MLFEELGSPLSHTIPGRDREPFEILECLLMARRKSVFGSLKS